MYTQDTIVDVWPFTRQREGDEVIIGRPETGSFLAVSSEAVDVLDCLAQGRSVGEAAAQAQSEVSDLDVFLSSLETLGLVRPRGLDVDVTAVKTKSPPVLRYHFSTFPQELAQRIFSRPVLGACYLLIGLAFSALIYEPSLWPHGHDLYFTNHRTLILLILLIVSFGSVVIHEISHVIATRAQGVNSRLGLGNRLWAFVVEADLTGLWSIPRQQRYLPLLAGSLFDAVMSSGLVLFLFAHNLALVAMSPFTVQLLRAILLTYMTRIMWQAFLFVRTDYYYVIANFFNCRNLMGDTEDYLRNQIGRIIPRIRSVDQSMIPASERRVIFMYAFMWTLGRLIAFTFLFEVTIPLVRRYTANTIHAITVGYSANPTNFTDSVLTSFIFGVPFTIGMLMWIVSIVRRLASMEVSA